MNPLTQDELLPCPFDKSVFERFNRKVAVGNDNDSCWLWTASTNGKRGYGKISVNDKLVLAHRLSYMIYKGEIPEGMTIDHKCNVRRCVNPNHLAVATRYDNSMRSSSPTAKNKAKKFCPLGHSLADARILKRADGVRRLCKICRPAKESKL